MLLHTYSAYSKCSHAHIFQQQLTFPVCTTTLQSYSSFDLSSKPNLPNPTSLPATFADNLPTKSPTSLLNDCTTQQASAPSNSTASSQLAQSTSSTYPPSPPP